MDRVYYPGSDLQAYLARRLPRGGSLDGGVAQPGGSTPLELNPVAISLYYLGIAIAPHATTTRAEYIVPPRRRAVVAPATVAHGHSTPSAIDASVYCGVQIIRAKDAPNRNVIGSHTAHGTYVEMARAHAMGNNGYGNGACSGPTELFAGDVLRIQTHDIGSAASRVRYTATASIVEFDAEVTMHTNRSAVGYFPHEGGGVLAVRPMKGF